MTHMSSVESSTLLLSMNSLYTQWLDPADFVRSNTAIQILVHVSITPDKGIKGTQLGDWKAR